MRIASKKTSGIATLYVIEVRDASRILTTYVDRPEKHIICFTTSVGCPVACRFCYAGKFANQLSIGELFYQTHLVYEDQGLRAKSVLSGSKPTLFSAMGEGEPLATAQSYDAVVGALQAMGTIFIGARLALSTTGINPPLVRQLARQRFPVDLKLQVSLVSPRDEVRRSLMKASASLADIRGSVGYYEQVAQREVEWNLVLLDGINDSMDDAYLTARLLGPGSRVKLNGYNAVPDCDLRRSPRTEEFADTLRRCGLKTEICQTDGWEIGAACGQFRAVSAESVALAK